MSGAFDPQYVQARRVLLDALDALRDHQNALILVGAQAIYLRAGDADLAIAPFTTDADLAIDPSVLRPDPKLAQALQQAGFFPDPDLSKIGIWVSAAENVTTDLLVPKAVAGPGRRSAKLGPHGDKVARQAAGLEAALVDKSLMRITALEETDHRSHEIMVAGAAALLVAKLHKLRDRQGNPSRSDNKDAFDIYRLLQATETSDLADTIGLLASNPLARESTRRGIVYLDELFGSPKAQGSLMVAAAVETLQDPDVIANASAALAADLYT